MTFHKNLAWASLLLVGALGTGCASSVSLKVLQPADVYVPPQIQTLAVIDRSQATSTGGKVLAALEGALTGEQIGLDQAGRREALNRVSESLAASPRFKIIRPATDALSVESDLLMSVLSGTTAQRICAREKCDAIVSLEMFDSDMTVIDKEIMTEYTDENGKPHKKRQHEAAMDGTLVIGWRLYDARQGTILDEQLNKDRQQHWSFTADTFQEAAAQLPSQEGWVLEGARYFGDFYARRIAPTYIYVERSYYASFDDRLKKAADHVKVNDWMGAVNIWETMKTDPNPKNRGKALYNLAIAKEVEGDLDGAYKLAQQSCIEKSNGRCRDYVAILSSRIADRAKLQQQLAPPPPVAPAPPPPPKGTKRK